MTAPEVLARYAAMFQAAREGRMEILQPDGVLSDYSRMVGKIEGRLQAGECREADVQMLRTIATEFREVRQAG